MSESKKPAKVTVYLVGNSRGHKDGDRRQFDAETAADLVENNLARYPDSKA
jgi:hypothetical protein